MTKQTSTVLGASLPKPLDAPALLQLPALLAQHKVLSLRNVTRDQGLQHALILQLGALRPHPLIAADAAEGGIRLDSLHRHQSPHWHPDLGFTEVPPRYSVLFAHDMPAEGGDGLWLDTHAAFNALPVSLQHDLTDLYGWHRQQGEDGTVYQARQPLVHAHPDSGLPHLFVGQHLAHIDGVSAAESARLLSAIHLALDNTARRLRWHWQAGDLLVYDNLATVHATVHDYQPQRRVLHWLPLGGQRLQAWTGR